jgi:hypothetical protein
VAHAFCRSKCRWKCRFDLAGSPAKVESDEEGRGAAGTAIAGSAALMECGTLSSRGAAMRPGHSLSLLGLVSGLVLVIGCVVAVVRPASGGPVYSVATLQARIEQEPHSWDGRTVLLRAIAEPCPWWAARARHLWCADQELVLAGMPREAPAAPFPLLRPAPNALWSILHKLTFLGNLLPRPRLVPLLIPARFRVRLVMLPPGACAGRLPCDESEWLDANLGSP